MEKQELVKLASAIAVAMLIDEGKSAEAATLAHTFDLSLEYCLDISKAYKTAKHTLDKVGAELTKATNEVMQKERA